MTDTMACAPEPQRRLMLSAGTASFMSFLSATCRAMYAASGDVCCTEPTTTVSMPLLLAQSESHAQSFQANGEAGVYSAPAGTSHRIRARPCTVEEGSSLLVLGITIGLISSILINHIIIGDARTRPNAVLSFQN